jgi:hypothetical protein
VPQFVKNFVLPGQKRHLHGGILLILSFAIYFVNQWFAGMFRGVVAQETKTVDAETVVVNARLHTDSAQEISALSGDDGILFSWLSGRITAFTPWRDLSDASLTE